MLPAPGCPGQPPRSTPLPAAHPWSASRVTLAAPKGPRPRPSRLRHAQRGPARGRDALAQPRRRPPALGAPCPRPPQASAPPPTPLPTPAAARRAPRPPRPPLQPAPRPARFRRRALIGWPGSEAALSGRADSLGQGCRGAWRTGGSGAAARARRTPAGRPPARQPERAARGAEGARAPPGAAALAAMCSQLWFLTDRRIREDYPQVQILRALRQRCSEQDVRFRAVLMDQIAVTIVGGNLGEPGGPGRAGRRSGVLESRRVGARTSASRSLLRAPRTCPSPRETSSGWRKHLTLRASLTTSICPEARIRERRLRHLRDLVWKELEFT